MNQFIGVYPFCFLQFLILNIILAADIKEIEHEVVIKDYGVAGIDKTVSLNLNHSLHAGSIIVIVSQTDYRGTINICDDKYNNLIQMDTRLFQKKVILNSYVDKKWGENNVQLKPAVDKGAQSVTTILYEEKGYRIFVNGKEVAFYEHRSTKPPRRLLAFNNRIYKIIYLATKEINGMVTTDCPTLQPEKKENNI